MNMSFTDEEKKDIRDALNNILDDARAIYDVSKIPELRCGVSVYKPCTYNGTLVINGQGTFLVRLKSLVDNTKEYIYLEKIIFGKKIRPKVKNYELAFGIIREYDSYRSYLEHQAKNYVELKKSGMEDINNIKKRYDKEAAIELEIPDSVNKSTIEITEENGQNIGRIKIGPISLKILTSPNVSITYKKEEKVKRK